MAADFNVYMEHPSVAGMSKSAANDWRAQHRVQVSGGQPAPNPVGSFLEASFPEFITAELEAAGFDRPTPIQSQSWPIALSGRDVIGLAATGSGKTLCFALPMIVHINAQPHMQPGDGPIALVLSPTRELALQTKGECDRFGASSGVTNTAIYGGVPKGPQERDLRQGVEIVTATPGRLIDFMDVRPRATRRPSSAAQQKTERGVRAELTRTRTGRGAEGSLVPYSCRQRAATELRRTEAISSQTPVAIRRRMPPLETPETRDQGPER